jgi:hypothetical protein
MAPTFKVSASARRLLLPIFWTKRPWSQARPQSDRPSTGTSKSSEDLHLELDEKDNALLGLLDLHFRAIITSLHFVHPDALLPCINCKHALSRQYRHHCSLRKANSSKFPARDENHD